MGPFSKMELKVFLVVPTVVRVVFAFSDRIFSGTCRTVFHSHRYHSWSVAKLYVVWNYVCVTCSRFYLDKFFGLFLLLNWCLCRDIIYIVYDPPLRKVNSVSMLDISFASYVFRIFLCYKRFFSDIFSALYYSIY